MRSAVLALWVALASACGSVGVETPREPEAPGVEAEAPPRVTPEPEPVLAVEPEYALPPEGVDEVDDEPEPPTPILVEKMWSERLEPRILAVQSLVAEAARAHGVDPYLVNGVIWVESKFDRKAKNRSGARGLMQLMPKTAKAIARKLGRPAKVYDAEFNVQAGAWYLSRMLAKFDGDESLALAAYVRGPSRIRAWLDNGEPFPASVQGFVGKVQRARGVFAALGWPEIDRSSTDMEPHESQ